MAKTGAARKAEPQSRYERVKAILNAAQGEKRPDYGGAGLFWNLGLDKFKEARVFGVRMIAPSQKSCCGESRSLESGLIKGLRGGPPFDGSRFPRLPWDGDPVPEEDIAFIAAWIDDGCPADDSRHTPLEMEAQETTRATVTDRSEFEVQTGAKRYPYRDGEPRQRANLDCLPEAEVERLRDAFRAIYDLNECEEDRRSYNNQALIHQNHCQHGWERFLPWHRAYLYEFEQNLQDFVSDVTLPYWDWTMPHYRPEKPQDGCIIPESFKAFFTEEAAHGLIKDLDPTQEQADGLRALARNRASFASQHRLFCYLKQELGFAVTPAPADPVRRRVLKALLESNALWYPLRYPAEYDKGQTINQAIHYHYSTAEDIEQILSLNNFRDFGGGNIYNASFGFLDQNPHNTMHIWTGGQNPEFKPPNDWQPAYVCDERPASNPELLESPDLGVRRNLMAVVKDRRFHRSEDLYSQPAVGDMFSNLTASYDPIFWPVHVNVDRLWWEWQQRNPSGVPHDLDAVLSPWSYTIRDMLDISRFGYEYVRCAFFMPVGMEAPISRFVSKPIRLDEKAKRFRKAEVRMHWVPQLARSCFVRAFLNLPGADASTPVRDNPHYAGYLAIFGHGECYGGPGHCDLPPVRARPFDQRPRSHNTPRNHRLDVTEAARKLLESGDELQITLLVIGVDYREEPELLKLEGVSLNLLD